MQFDKDISPNQKNTETGELAATTTEDRKTYITASSDIQNLTSGSGYRGCIDGFSDMRVQGWAIASENPLRQVTLEVYLCDIPVAKVRTQQVRNDIIRAVGLPLKAGFKIGLNGIANGMLDLVIKALKKYDTQQVPIDEILTVKVTNSLVKLPLSMKLRQQKVDIAPLLASLDSAVGMKTRNEYISIRDHILESTTFQGNAPDVKAVAYYLPQFHAFAENNDWWGTGFTEWTNVTTAKPYFEGHNQPRLPADLGYYDLRLAEIQQQQIALAKKYSLSGFCYYYYWFGGKTLMTMPIDRHLEENYDFDFCLCWANENWSRRWDGSENDVLMAQSHSIEDDVAFINSCLKYFKSERYIKIDGAPLLQVYRVSLLEDPKSTIARWREIVKEAGFPDLHVSMVESFGLKNPYDFGCDSSSQFPPHGVTAGENTQSAKDLDPAFTGKIFNYSEVVSNEINRPAAGHPQFRAAMPSWDNTSRKGRAGNVFHGATPELFETWLSHIVGETRRNMPSNMQMVFINAWNEWAEGAHLEPDRKNGHENLRAVRSSLSDKNKALFALNDRAGTFPENFPIGEVRDLVENLLNSNKHLTEIVRQYPKSPSHTSAFVPLMDGFLDVSLAGAKDRCWIDQLNGFSSDDVPTLTLSRKQHLNVSGWVQIAGVRLSRQVPFFIALTSQTTDRTYIASVNGRRPREDVLKAMNLESDALWCGFDCTAELSSLPLDSYDLAVLIVDPRQLSGAFKLPTAVTLLIG